MTRDELVEAAHEWFEADRKQRGGCVLLGEVTDDGKNNASIVGGYNPAILGNLLLFVMNENEAFADLLLDICEQYRLRKNAQN